MDKIDIGKRIKTLREEKGLTLFEVSEIIGVHKGTVQRYEIGEIDIKRNTAIELGRIFGVSPAYIMGWTDDRNGNIDLPKEKKDAVEKILSLNDSDFNAAIEFAEYLAKKRNPSDN